MDDVQIQAFISRWAKSGGAERANYQLFLSELCDALDVPRIHVLAVPIHFHPDGRYDRFDPSSPLARNGGKVDLLAARPPEERPIAFVGDGVTDLEAAPVVGRFVGFGGVARRPAVERAADCYALGPSLATTLPFLLTAEEQAQLRAAPAFATLLTER